MSKGASGLVADEQLLAELRQFADRLGTTPTSSQMRADGPRSPTTYQNRFGSWNEALRAAGLEENAVEAVPEAELCRELRRLDDRLNGVPTPQDVRANGQYAVGPYYRVFGDFQTAREAAGINDRPAGTWYSDAELLAEIDRLADGNIPPRKQEMLREGDYGTSTYENRFGSWIAALREAGYTVRRGGTDFYEAVRRAHGDASWPAVQAAAIGEECRMCGATDSLEVHHIIPVLAGGTNEDWNLLTLCASCHRRAERYTERFTVPLTAYA